MKITSIIAESQHKCPHCGGPVVEYSELMEKKDACYYKVKASAKVWPSAYASGRLVQCRKKGASNYGKKNESVAEGSLEEVDRRGFLKGVGAAAVAGAAGTGIGYEIGKKEKTSKLQMPSNPQAYFLLGYVYNMISGLMLNSNTEMSKWSNEMFDLHSQAKVEVASSDNNNLEMSYHKGTKSARDTINEIKGWNNYPIDPTGKAAGLTQDQAWEYDRKFRNDKEIARQIENKTRPYYDKLMKMVRQNESVQQGVAEGFNGEYDDEAGMAQGNLYTIAQAAQGLLDTIDDRDNLPEWAQEKIAKVEGMLVSVWNYLQSQKAQGMDPKVAEGDVKPFVIPDDNTQGNYENQGYRKNLQDQFALIDYTFNKVILTTNDIKQAKQEAIEWAEYDDIPVAVKNQQTNKIVFKVDGAAGAERYLDESVDTEITEMYEAMQNLVTEMAQKNKVSEDAVWEQFEAMPDNILYETAAWRRKEGKSKKGGLNAKGVASYRRENPGSKLQTAVTTKPSKLKPGSKAAKRRKSFCARMGGVKGPMKKPNGKPTRKALALRKWNC